MGKASRSDVQHIGFKAGRALCASGDLEAAFALQWMQLNEHPNRQLERMLSAAPEDERRQMTQRDAHVAATVIQWLGTNNGLGFLSGVLKEHGYEIREVYK